MDNPRLLLVEDDSAVRFSLKVLLENTGYKVDYASTGSEAWDLITRNGYPLILCDINLPGMDGREILEGLKRTNTDSDLILFTGYGSISDAVECIRKGAYDYLAKPIDNEKLLKTVKKVLAQKALRFKAPGRASLSGKASECELVFHSKSMEDLLRKAKIVAATDATVLITGQSGTGKTLLAKYIHNNCKRADRPFVEVSCGALSETLLESELFGHKRGSFTGALKAKMGKFEAAEHGTIFLDDINSASLGLQKKLLRIIEEKVFERVGDTKTLTTDARIIAATNKDLRELSKQGLFREDLYHRLNVVNLEIPSLAERKEDIPVLVRRFLNSCARRYKRPFIMADDTVMKALSDHNWQGNVRELENAIERMVIFAQGSRLTVSDLPKWISKEKDRCRPGAENLDLTAAQEIYERAHILRVLESNAGNRTKTARDLNISRATLFNKMKKYRLFSDSQNGGGSIFDRMGQGQRP